MSTSSAILGIDPGIGRLGFAVATTHANQTFHCLAVGCLTTPAHTPPPQRLAALTRDVRALIVEHQPVGVVLENIFFSKNVKTAMAVAEARGAMLALCGERGLPVIELSPQAVKMSVAGVGNATKDQVQHMVQRLFSLSAPPKPDDAADALALAFAGLSYFRKPLP